MPKPRCVVLGAGGFIGSNLVAFLKEKGHWVRAVDIEFPEFRKELWGQADKVVTEDLRYETDGLLIEPKPNWIFHLAADMGGVGYFHSDKDQGAARDNMRIDLNVLDALKPEQRLFYSSSACSYPKVLSDPRSARHRPLREDDWGDGFADQLYGEEKRMMTLLCEKQSNARVGIFHTIYGPYQEYEGERMKFPTAITRKVIEAGMGDRGVYRLDGESVKPCIEIWGDGTQVRTFQFIDDALEKIYRVMSADKYEGPVNIGSNEGVTVKEVADELCEHAGIVPHYNFNTDKPTGVLARSSDNTKFERLYGKVPQTSAKEGFRKLYDYLSRELA